MDDIKKQVQLSMTKVADKEFQDLSHTGVNANVFGNLNKTNNKDMLF